MNLRRLTNLLAAFQRLMVTVAEQSAQIDAELTAIRTEIDPFARHVFQARRDYGRTSDRDKTKHERHCTYACRRSYTRAVELGYRGNEHEWLRVLTAFPPHQDKPSGNSSEVAATNPDRG